MSKKLLFLKLLLTVPVACGLVYPFVYPGEGRGVLDEVMMFGPAGALLVAMGFLSLVFLYAKDLVHTLQLVRPEARMTKPQSVWLMFLIPFNFVEDFFIIHNVSCSLRAEAEVNAALQRFRSFGLWSGLGWCAAQIVSLLPNTIGAAAGMLAMVLWVWHWVFIRRVIGSLRSSQCTD